MKFFRAILLFSLLAVNLSYTRSLAEIKKSGYIIIATRNKETVYKKGSSGKGYTGLHYHLTQHFANHLNLKIQYQMVQMKQYFESNYLEKPKLLETVDIYADNLTATIERISAVHFIPLFNAIEICLFSKNTKISKVNDLSKYKTSITKGTSYEALIRDLEAYLGTTLNFAYAPNTSAQVWDVINKKTDYTIMDSDQVKYYVNKHNALRYNIQVLANYAEIKSLGWVTDKKHIALQNEIKTFFTRIKKNQTFNKLFIKIYGQDYTQYKSFVNKVANAGSDLYKKSIALARKNQYRNAMVLLNSERNRKEQSPKLTQFYNRMFLKWLAYDQLATTNQSYELIKYFLINNPPSAGIEILQKKHPQIISSYHRQIKIEKKYAYQAQNLDKLIELQKQQVLLEPKSVPVQKELERLYYLQFKKGNPINSSVMFTNNMFFTNNLLGKSNLLTESTDNTVIETQTNASNNQATEKSEQTEDAPVTISNVAPVAIFVPVIDEHTIESHEGEKYFNAGMLYMRNMELEKALVAFQDSLSLNFQVTRSSNFISLIESKILKEKERALAKRLAAFQSNYQLAIEMYIKNHLLEAMDAISRAIEIFPDNIAARKYFGIISDKLQLENRKTINQYSPYYNYYLNKTAIAAGFLDQSSYMAAKKIYEEILFFFPLNELAKEKLSFCLFKLEPQKYISLISNYFAQANSHFQNKQFKPALEKYKLIRQYHPAYPGIDGYIKNTRSAILKKSETIKLKLDYNNEMALALRLYQEGKLMASLKKYQLILKQLPDDYKASINSARIEMELGMRKMSPIDHQIKKQNKKLLNARNYYLKGNYYFRLKKYSKAIQYWEKTLHIDPTYKKAQIDIRRVKKFLQR